VLYIQLATPKGTLELQAAGKGGDLRATLWDERRSFLKSALQLLVSCHVVVWAQEGGQLRDSFLEQLRILQATHLLYTCPTLAKKQQTHWGRPFQSA